MNNHVDLEYSLEKVQSGDRAEFAKLINAHSDHIFRLAIKILGNEQDAEDVLQNTFLKAFEKIDSFEGRSSVSTWLYRIATNEALMLIRKQKPEMNISELVNEDNEEIDAPVQFIDWCCLPEGELLSDETRKIMDKAIHELSDALRIVFILRDIEGLSIRETSQVLELSETAIKTRLLRARLKLREMLTTYFKERVPDGS